MTAGTMAAAAGAEAANSTSSFVRTHGVGICRGRYAAALRREWHAWDARNGSENDPVDAFRDDQLFVVFVVENGGADLERFEVHGFEEARSILLQVLRCCCRLCLLMLIASDVFHWLLLLIIE
jgi:serine/threonine-protein kinase haspin